MTLSLMTIGLAALTLTTPMGDATPEQPHLAQTFGGTIQVPEGAAPEPRYLVGFSCAVAENSQGWFTDIVITRDRGGAIPGGTQVTWIVPPEGVADSAVLPARGRGVGVRLRNVLPLNTEPNAGCIVGQ